MLAFELITISYYLNVIWKRVPYIYKLIFEIHATILSRRKRKYHAVYSKMTSVVFIIIGMKINVGKQFLKKLL